MVGPNAVNQPPRCAGTAEYNGQLKEILKELGELRAAVAALPAAAEKATIQASPEVVEICLDSFVQASEDPRESGH